MAHRILGFKKAREISMTRKGMNEHATRVVIKSFGAAPPPEAQESPEMDAKIMKALLGLSDVEKTYFLTLEDAPAVAFLAKSAADKKTEMDAAKSPPNKVTDGDADDKAKSAQLLEMQKSLDESKAKIAELEKSSKEAAETTEVEKAARDPAYDGYPGGEEKLIPLIKSARKLPDDERDAILALAKSQAQGNKMMAKNYGHGGSATELQKSAPAQFEVEQKAIELSKSASIDIVKARGRVLADPANAQLAQRAYDEAELA